VFNSWFPFIVVILLTLILTVTWWKERCRLSGALLYHEVYRKGRRPAEPSGQNRSEKGSVCYDLLCYLL